MYRIRSEIIYKWNAASSSHAFPNTIYISRFLSRNTTLHAATVAVTVTVSVAVSLCVSVTVIVKICDAGIGVIISGPCEVNVELGIGSGMVPVSVDEGGGGGT